MTVFWGLAGIMVIAALLFVVPVIMRTSRLSNTDQDALNTAVIKSQLADLKTDLETGRLDQDQYAAARKDLEQELLDDLSRTGNGRDTKPPRSGRWAVPVVVVVIPLLATALYYNLGAKDIIPLLARAPVTPPHPAPAAATAGGLSIEQMVEKLAARLQEQPDDPEGWTMLARSYRVLERYPEAVTAYQQALQRDSDNVALMVSYVDVLTMSHDGRFTAEAAAMLRKALELQPDNVVALWLSGHQANQQGRYADAISYWQRAEALLPDDSPDKAVIGQQIAAARQQAGGAGTGVTTTVAETAASDTPAAATGLQVRVTLDSALQQQADPEATVFIFARAVNGPRMPLAIQRKQVRDLPLTVVLDDSLAMSPAMTLSKFDKVTVGARVSKSGNAMPQSGDLQGLVSPVATRDSQVVQLVIDGKVP
jgi:cytochrome c-type biogenesis protein CcmH